MSLSRPAHEALAMIGTTALVFCVSRHGDAKQLFGIDIGERPVGIASVCDQASEDYRATAESLFLDTLIQHGYRVFDRSRLEELRDLATQNAVFEEQDQEQIRRIREHFDVDVILKVSFQADAAPALGKYWIGTANMECTAISTSTSRILGTSKSADMGVPGAPAPIGTTKLAAIGSALRVAAAQVMQSMGIPDASIPPQTKMDGRTSGL